MHWRLASEGRTGELTATIGDHFVHVHVELSTAARHPNVQWEHVSMLAGENFVAGLYDQFVPMVVEPFTFMVSYGRGLLQNGIGNDHFAGNQIRADTEMLKRPLRLCTP